MPGYSGTPLAKKLGIKDGARVALIGMPRGFEDELEGLPEGAKVKRGAGGTTPFDVIIYAPKNAAALGKELAPLITRLAQDGGLWLCWPKKASRVATDLSETLVRDAGLATGLVDN